MSDLDSTLLGSLITGSHFLSPDELPALISEHGERLGASDVALYLADYDQRLLVPVSNPPDAGGKEIQIDATIAGRCYRTLAVQTVGADNGSRRVWVPVLDGTERLGVLGLVFGAGTGDEAEDSVASFAAQVAELVMGKSAYGDFFEQVRRRQPMSLAAELAWRLLPPLTFGSDRVVITAALAPPYDLGGDAFDYAVDAHVARFAVFDAIGHGLSAGMMSTVAMAAYRNSRRRGLDLVGTATFIDEAIATHVGDANYVTGVLAELELGPGRLRWFTAGHPRPLILRRGRIVRTLEEAADVPFGLGTRPTVGEEVLEPDDRLILYTDGIVEARAASGELFGVDRFADVLSLASSENSPPPETMRRLLHSVLDHQFGLLRDDATALMVQWPGHASEQLGVR